jgi:extracellular elastinolytic metalloproteinase
MTKHIFTLIFAFILFQVTYSQSNMHIETATQYLRSAAEEWNLKPADVLDLKVSSAYTNSKSGAQHIYFVQRYSGIDIYNAVANVHIKKDGAVFYSTSRFVSDIGNKIDTYMPKVTPQSAVQAVASHIGHSSFAPVQISSERNANTYLFSKGEISHVDIPARLMYFPTKEDKLILVWDVELDQIDGEDYWSIRVDATSGDIVDVSSFTVKCHVPDGAFHQHESLCFEQKAVGYGSQAQVSGISYKAPEMFSSQATYKAVPFPAESPAHGPIDFVNDRFNAVASPYGWHDTNGVDGPEYTVTRGNNVNAWPARNNENTAVNQPNGGPELYFDFPYDGNSEPDASLAFATVNLFYATNMMHDITYAYGFDEVSGNFQQNNYGRGGLGNDHVIARAQAGANEGSVNNANFSTPADGGNGRMNMFVWNRSNSGLLRVIEPEDIARKYDTGNADFGTRINAVPITGKVVIARDNTGQPLLGCETLNNPTALAGNIAMVDRGGCFFIQKTVRAEAAGARGLIICNFENTILNMAGAAGFPDPGIPAVLLSSNDCLSIKRAIDRGEEVIVTFVNEDTSGPLQIDGTLDNGIIAHEFGHGISNRLTGGPNASGCLGNDEQMGEGWSDFFSLITSVQQNDRGTDPRGIGTFVLSQPKYGTGIRRYPYSTDMSVNPITYDDIIGTTAPHPLGEVWVAMLWDLYWAMVDRYGYDDDILNGTGGNNKAIQLVMDGMRLQPCGPGFVDGRNAILAADQLNFNGENECLIWEVFARRGLGYDADQGSPTNRNDGTEGYEILPSCYNQLRLVKTMTESIEAGDEIEITLRIENFKPIASTGIVVTDQIPDGTTYIANSASQSADLQGNQIVFQIDAMSPVEIRTITYRVLSSENRGSTRIFFDDFEDPDTEFDYEFESFKGIDTWVFGEDMRYEGDFSMIIYDSGEQDQAFYNFTSIRFDGNKPILRFWHDYDTQKGFDAGTIELSDNGGTTFFNADPYIFKNGFIGKVDYSTFTLPNIRGFSGKSDGFIQSFIDLSNFKGTDFHFRFRFGANATVSTRQVNWAIDNLELMDAYFYNSEACITANGGGTYCTEALERGTLVESGIFTSISQSDVTPMDVVVFPNPSSGHINLLFRNLNPGNVEVELMSMEGKLLKSNKMYHAGSSVNMSMNINELQNGVYLLRMKTGDSIRVERIILRK